MKITFLGATHEVTGSCTLLTVGDMHILVDCGMEQGNDMFENQELPVNPAEIDCVLLTHAHIDHSGNLPLLYKNGFKGTVYATESTANLCEIMLRDSAHIQEMEAEWKNRKAKRAGVAPIEPVYSMADAEGVLENFRRCPYEKMIPISEHCQIRFTDIGHLLGSSAIEVWLYEGETRRKIVFSGDVGNQNKPILKNPKHIEEADYVVIESTYGDRYHGAERPDFIRMLADCLQRTFDRGGNVVIPSFAVGRTQELLYFIRTIKDQGLVVGHDGFPVYMDSPLANEATGVFLQCDISDFDRETVELIEQGINPLWFPDLRMAVTAEDSKAINFDTTPKVIISASGMCEAGRIRHHLKHNLWRKECTVLFAGYQAVGSLGRTIEDGVDTVKLFGEEVQVEAEIAHLPGVSGHADKAGLIDWLGGFTKKPLRVFVNHGDDAVCVAFRDCLTTEYGYNAYAPYSGTEFDLATGAILVETHAVPLKKKTSSGRRVTAHTRLMDAVSRLLAVAQACEGMSNKDLGRFTSQIDSLIDKWRKEE